MSGTRKILIVGNGFDLAHFLPTKYEHFIHAMKVVETSDKKSLNFAELFNDLQEDDFIIKNTIKFYDIQDLILDDVSDIKEKLFHNGWFQYFKNYLNSGIETWIDFENEINNALNSICEILNILKDNLFFYENESYMRSKFIFDNRDIYNFHFDMLSFMKIVDFDRTSDFQDYYFDKIFLKVYQNNIQDIKFSEVFKHLQNNLNEFIDIFSSYIEFINQLQLKEDIKLEVPQVFQHNLETVYSFNYSSTIERLYNHNNVKYLHGKAGNIEKNRIVLGVSELENQLLKDEKAYGFVKYYQKLANDTDYQFLRPKSIVSNIEDRKISGEAFGFQHPLEIYIWGHSLDSSDSDYIQEIFSFNQGKKPSVKVIVYFFGSLHVSLANLIHIVGRETIENWMKNEWLEFIETPDIHKLNFDDSYVDKVSEFSKSISSPRNKI